MENGSASNSRVWLSYLTVVITYTVAFAYDEVSLNLYENFINCWFLKNHVKAESFTAFCANASERAANHEYDAYKYRWSTLGSSYTLGSSLGAIFFPIGDLYGRKKLLLIGGSAGFLGNLLKITGFYTNTYGAMLLGQLVASLRMGIGILMAAMYLVEIAPEGKGDFFGVSFAVGFSSGHFLGAFLGIENIFGGVETWQYSICVGLGLGVIQLLLHPLIMESPSWIEESKVKTEKTYRAILSEYVDDIKSVWTNQKTRSSLFWATLITSTFLLCGTDVMYQYSLGIIQSRGITSDYAGYITVTIMMTAAIASGLAMYSLPKIGKRQSFLLSALGMALSISAFYYLGTLKDSPYIFYFTAVPIVTFMMSAELGALPVLFIIAVEWFDVKQRMAVQCFIQIFSTCVMSVQLFMFPKLMLVLEHNVFLVLAGVNTMLFVFGWFKLKFPDEQTPVDSSDARDEGETMKLKTIE